MKGTVVGRRALVIVTVGSLAAGCSRGTDAPPHDPGYGRWRLAAGLTPPPDLTPDQRESVAQLLSLGYLDGYEPAPGLEGVTVHRPDSVEAGLNLYTSGHGPEALLIDMEGTVVHRWRCSFREAFPNYPVPAGMTLERDYWRRVHLYENGDLLAIFEGLGLIKIDRNSRILWTFPRPCHHDLYVDEHGTIYVLTRKLEILPRVHPGEPVFEDYITLLDPRGDELGEISLLRAFEDSRFSSTLEGMPDRGDLLHTNTLEVLDGSHAHRSPVFSKGNFLVSLLTLDTIAIVGGETGRVVWTATGSWVAQHQPTLLPNGNMLLFDNRGNGDLSKVIEIDPLSLETVWSYEGTTENGFSTFDCGSSQRLGNGNTLITQSNSGRAFEVTPSGAIVWEFYNPARAGERRELIATLFEVVRLPPGFAADWASAR